MRMSRVRISAATVIAVLLVSVVGVPVTRSAAAEFRDMEGHWAQADVDEAARAGLVSGYPDGSFRPEESVTRAQFIAMMTRVRGLAPSAGAGGFADLQGHWLSDQGWIEPAVDAHLVEPSDYGDPPTLAPDRPITRAEAAVLATRAMNRLGASLTLHGAPLPYADNVPDWVTGYVAAITSAGVLKGNSDGTFGPGAPLTRAQAAAIARRVLGAAGADEVPVWEGNSWTVSTLPYEATQVTAAPDGTLWWIRRQGGEVWRMKPGDQPGLVYSGLDELPAPRPMAAGPDGLYVARGRGVLHITPGGQAEPWAGDLQGGDGPAKFRDGPGEEARFAGVSGLCTDPAGNLYVTEGIRVRKVDPQRHVTTLSGLKPLQNLVLEYGFLYGRGTNLNEGTDGPGYLAAFRGAGACAADGTGNVYVVDGNNAIRRVAPDGSVTWVAGREMSNADGAREEAGFEDVTSLAADPWGNLWLTELRHERIRRITPDGHVYTVAGGGGTATLTHGLHEDVKWPAFIPENRQVDGPGPDARFSFPTTLALAGGKLYVTDGASSLRVVTGATDWYPGEKGVVLQPLTDDLTFWTFGGGRFSPGPARLSVALYGPAEAVALRVDGEWTAETHHPVYTMKWDAAPGSHRLVPQVRRPDTTWAAGAARDAEVAPDGAETGRSWLVLPRDGSWVQGTVDLRAVSDWDEAAITVDGETVARGTGLITAAWDTTRVPDGLHRIGLRQDGQERMLKQVYVGNGGFPAPEPEADGFTLYLNGERHIYQGSLLPRQQDGNGIVLLPLKETAGMFGYSVSWDPETRVVTLTGAERAAELNVETGETSGMVQPVGPITAIQEGDDWAVDWLFFVGLTNLRAAFDGQSRVIIFFAD